MSSPIGQSVILDTFVKDSNGTLTDATVSLTITKPDGTTVTPSITHPGTGHYQSSTVPNLAGSWLYLWSITGTLTGTDYGQFEVTSPTLRINSLADIKTHLNKASQNATDDAEVQDMADAAQSMIEREIGTVVPKSYVEYHNGGCNRISLWRGPIVSVTSIVENLNGTFLRTLTSQEYRIDAKTSSVVRTLTSGADYAFAGWDEDVVITYVAGRTQPIPANIRLAHKELTAHMWRNQIGRSRRSRGNVPEDDMSPGLVSFSMPNRIREMIGARKPMVF